MDRILLNQWALWGDAYSSIWGGGGGEIIGDSWFAFDWFSLHRADWSIRVKACDYDDIWAMDFNTFKNPDNDWGGVLSKYYRTKTINISLSITKETEEELDDLIDELKYRTSKTEWYLDIFVWAFRRRRTATLTSLKFNRKYYNVTRCGEVQLSFQCTNPHGRWKEIKSLTFQSLWSDYTEEILYNWSARSDFKMTFIVNTASATKLTVKVNGYKQEITTNISNGDIITYDGEEKEIKVNGVNQRYSWPFEQLKRGMNNIRIQFEWTINYDLSVIYKEKYL